MKKRRVVYIIPGFQHLPSDKGYPDVARWFAARGVKPVRVRMTWNYRVMSDYVAQFLEIVEKQRPREFYYWGFSYGAMIAFIASTKLQPKAQMLCSLSPYFREDLAGVVAYAKKIGKKPQHFFGKRRRADFEQYSFTKLAREVTCPTILTMGSEEKSILIKRVNDAHKRIKKSRLIIADDAAHDIAQKEYADILRKAISTMKL